MGQLQTLDQKIAGLKSVNEVFTLQEVKDRFIKNYESCTGRKDGENRMEQERFAYLQILQEKPDLQKVDKLYHFMALVYAGTTGLSFRDNKLYVIPAGNGKLKVQSSPAGKREMMEMMQDVESVPEAVLVMIGDHFVHDKLNGVVREHYSTEKTKEKIILENIRAAYVRVIFKGGKNKDVVVYQEELIKAKNKSKMSNVGPWVDWVGEMCKKVATNRAFRLYHRYPDNVVLYGQVDAGDEDTETVPYTDVHEVTAQHENVDTETGEITPTEDYEPDAPEPKKEKKTKPQGEQQSFI